MKKLIALVLAVVCVLGLVGCNNKTVNIDLPFALIFVGQNEFLRTLRLKALEPLRQRINMNYTFTGFNEEEVRDYVVSRLKSVNCRSDLFKDECYHTLYSMMNTSVRILNQLINKSLILGMHYNKETIDSELVMQASKELMLG